MDDTKWFIPNAHANMPSMPGRVNRKASGPGACGRVWPRSLAGWPWFTRLVNFIWRACILSG